MSAKRARRPKGLKATSAKRLAPSEAPSSAAADPAAAILERCRSLAEDLSLPTVRRWKEEHPGALAIGYMPIYAPRPLLEAMGCLPVALFGGGDQLEIIRGDSYFQSYICHIPRSTLELALSGRPRRARRHDLPVDLRRRPQPERHVRMLFPERCRSTSTSPRTSTAEVGGRFYAEHAARDRRPARGARRPAAHRRRAARRHRRRERAPGGARPAWTQSCRRAEPSRRRRRRLPRRPGRRRSSRTASTRPSSDELLRALERRRARPSTTPASSSSAPSASSRRST
jgi:hypothetical protein